MGLEPMTSAILVQFSTIAECTTIAEIMGSNPVQA